MQRFAAEFRITPATRILDVGGTAFNWYLLPVRPDVVLLNLEPELTGGIATPFQVIAADGCELPFKDQSFDIVFCNSLIEHLPPPRQKDLAAEIRRVGRGYFVQTPNFWFPVEPHFMAPFIHWLPSPVRRAVVRWATPWGWITRPNRRQAQEAVDEIHLLVAAAMRVHFPDGTVHRERVGPLTKSLISFRPSTPRVGSSTVP